MLVSHRHRFIYTKTVKTGGTSVESYFEPYCMAEGEWSESHDRDEYESPAGIVGYRGEHKPADCRWWNHMPAQLIKERLGDAIWSAYFKFCVARNPYDKAISAFYFRRSRQQIAPEPGESDEAHFERWLTSAKLPSDSNKYLIDGKLCVDFVIKYEHLAADLERVCARLKLPWEPERLPFFKAGIRPAWATVERLYTPRAEEIVRKAYTFEIETFGYSFAALLEAERNSQPTP